MSDYQQRVVNEKEQLDIKREALRAFIMSPKEIEKLSDVEKDLLSGQMILMQQYSDILGRRIQAFE